MFVGNGAVTSGPSRECDITFFVKGRPKSARQSRDSTVAARRVQSVTVPSSRVSRECRSPGLRSPPFKNARFICFPSLFFFVRFPFSKDFRGSAKRRTLAFFRVSLAVFQKRKGWRVRAERTEVAIFAIAIANFHHRLEIAAIYSALLNKETLRFKKLRISFASNCNLILRIPTENRTLSSEFNFPSRFDPWQCEGKSLRLQCAILVSSGQEAAFVDVCSTASTHFDSLFGCFPDRPLNGLL